MRRLTLGLLVCLIAWTPVTRAGARADARVLFIGNSLTYANDLPGMVAALSRGRIETAMIAFPDFSLEDHWQRGEALDAIRRGGWTHVVLQQGPSSLAESRRVLVREARRFAEEARKVNAAVVLYGVWPPSSRRPTLAAVTGSYAAAAEASGGTLVAAGEGWRAAWKKDAALPLYGPDGFHPSPLGTYLAALMFVEHLSGTAPAAPSSGAHGVSRERLMIVHDAASAAVAARR